jgi:hypothetical protein
MALAAIPSMEDGTSPELLETAFAGFDGATFTLAPNEGAIFSVFNSFQEREPKGQTAKRILATINQRLAGIEDVGEFHDQDRILRRRATER